MPPSTRKTDLLDRLVLALDQEAVGSLSVQMLSEQLRVPTQAIVGVTQYGVEMGVLFAMDRDRWVSRNQLASCVRSLSAAFPDRPFGPAEAKAALGLGRGATTQVLDLLSALGWVEGAISARSVTLAARSMLLEASGDE